jgi:hypothetical protein
MQQFKQGFLPNSFDEEWSTYLSRIEALEQEQEPRLLRNLNLDDYIVPFASTVYGTFSVNIFSQSVE